MQYINREDNFIMHGDVTSKLTHPRWKTKVTNVLIINNKLIQNRKVLINYTGIYIFYPMFVCFMHLYA